MSTFEAQLKELTDKWSGGGTNIEAVESILRFIEDHPVENFGSPGLLVHIVERFYRMGYEEKLIESVDRKPTKHTVWMLNRVINGTVKPEQKQRLIENLERVLINPCADHSAIHEAKHFLAFQARSTK